jgi:hypothetical protein
LATGPHTLTFLDGWEANMVHRQDVDKALLALSWRQREDLKLMGRFKKWTPALLAMYQHLDQSSANRRLRKLVKLEALAVLRGQPLPDGGRTPDVYYLTPLGARLVTRLLQMKSSYVEAPDVSNLDDNRHDLTTLEVAVRIRELGSAAAFEKMPVVIGPGETLTVIPDLAFWDGVFMRSEVFVEVEQTTKPEHYIRKFENYGKISAAYQRRGSPAPLLIIVYPSREIEQLLLDDHVEAASEVHYARPGSPLRVASVCLDTLRERKVCSLERRSFGADADGRPLVIEAEGLRQCLYTWFDDAWE